MPEHDLDLLTKAAHAAAEVVRPYFRNAPRQWDKGGSAGPVTEADIAVNDRLAEVLRTARPDYGWLSEESPATPDRLTARRSFVIDPIDGTRAFIDGQDSFSHSLAVVEGGRTIAAVVYLPIRDRLYAAAADGAATCNGAAIAPASPAGVTGARILTSKSALVPNLWREGAIPPFHREFRPSIAWRLCLVAEGRFDGTLSFRQTWDWDIAAGCLIAERAGATVTDTQGAALRFDSASAQSPGLWVAPPALHADLLGRIAQPGQGASHVEVFDL